MESPEYRPRPGDELVEPLFAALEAAPGEARGEGESDVQEGGGAEGVDHPEKSSGPVPRWLLVVAMGAGVILALAMFWESVQRLFGAP